MTLVRAASDAGQRLIDRLDLGTWLGEHVDESRRRVEAAAKSLGIDCPSLKYIGVKSAAHFRASFERFAGTILNVDAQAIHTHDFKRLPYKKRTRAVFPVEIPPRT